MGYNPEQVQDFYPTPSTLSTVMYYTGLDPRTMEHVYVPTDPHEKAMQRALIQYRNPKHYYLVKEALIKAHREDLIGSGPKCLIRAVPPRAGGTTPQHRPSAGKSGSRPVSGKPVSHGAKPAGSRKPAASAAPGRRPAPSRGAKPAPAGKKSGPKKR